jgi:hypothetical protein
MTADAAGMMTQSPTYRHYAAHAQRPEDWPVLIGWTAELLKRDHDWSAEIRARDTPTLLVFADADSVRPAHITEFFAFLGGGLHDAGWDGSARLFPSSPCCRERRTTTSCIRRCWPPPSRPSWTAARTSPRPVSRPGVCGSLVTSRQYRAGCPGRPGSTSSPKRP